MWRIIYFTWKINIEKREQKKSCKMEPLNLQPQTGHNRAILRGWGADKRSESDWELSQIPKERPQWNSEFNLEKQWEFASTVSHLTCMSSVSCALMMPTLLQHPQGCFKPHQKQRAGGVQGGCPLEVAVSTTTRYSLWHETLYYWDLPALCGTLQWPGSAPSHLLPGAWGHLLGSEKY